MPDLKHVLPYSPMNDILALSRSLWWVAALAGIGFFTHAMLTGTYQFRQATFGGIFAGFLAWVTACLLIGSGLDPMLACPVAAILGASGERGYEWILSKAQGRLGGNQ